MDAQILNHFLKNDINRSIIWMPYIENFLTGSNSLETFFENVYKIAHFSKRGSSIKRIGNSKTYYVIESLFAISSRDKKVAILYNDLSDYPKYLQTSYADSLEFLKSILTMRIIKFEIYDNVADCNLCDYIIPLTSFANKDCNKLNINKLLYFDYNNYSIIKCDKSSVEMYKKTFDMTHSICNYVFNLRDMTPYKYNYIFIDKLTDEVIS